MTTRSMCAISCRLGAVESRTIRFVRAISIRSTAGDLSEEWHQGGTITGFESPSVEDVFLSTEEAGEQP